MEWSDANKAVLIENVKNAPVLWQPTHAMYGKRGPRDSAFKKIAKMFNGCDAKEISKKWENLRRSHRRHVNKSNTYKKSGSAAPDLVSDDDEDDSDRNLWDNMAFLEPYMKIQPTFSNMNENDDISDSVNDPACAFDNNDFLNSTSQANDTSEPSETHVNPTDVETDVLNSNVESDNEYEYEMNNATETGKFEKKSVATGKVVIPRRKNNQSSPSQSNVLSKKKKKKLSKAIEDENNVLKVISNSLQEQSKALNEQAKQSKSSSLADSKDEDENCTYGKYVANELRSISDPYTRDYIKHELNQILFSAKWGVRPARSNSALLGNVQGINNSQMQSVSSISISQQQPHQPQSFFNVIDPAPGANEQQQRGHIRPDQSNSAMLGSHGQRINNSQMQSVSSMPISQHQPHQPQSFFNVLYPTPGTNEQQQSQCLEQSHWQGQRSSYAAAASETWEPYGNNNQAVVNDNYELTSL